MIPPDQVTSILDIGANVGSWTLSVKPLWPQARYLMIEANPGCQEALEDTGEDYLIALLGETPKHDVPFYTLDGTATGASVYREIGTDFYKEVEPICMDQTTLDLLLPSQSFDLIKLDTQGSELDILRGGRKLVARAQFVFTEVSTTAYNQGAPLMPAVVDYLDSIGFCFYQCVNSYQGINQHDLLFSRQP